MTDWCKDLKGGNTEKHLLLSTWPSPHNSIEYHAICKAAAVNASYIDHTATAVGQQCQNLPLARGVLSRCISAAQSEDFSTTKGLVKVKNTTYPIG